MKRALIILLIFCNSHPLLAGVESIGGNATLTLPADWIVDQRSPSLKARSPDDGVVLEAGAEAVAPGWIPLVAEAGPERDGLIEALWKAQVLWAGEYLMGLGFPLAEIRRETFGVEAGNGFVIGFGNFTIRGTFEELDLTTQWTSNVAIDSGHVYTMTMGYGASASAQRRAEVTAVMLSLSTSNPFAVQNGGLGPIFVEVSGGMANLTLSVLESDNLVTWTEVAQVQASVPVSGRAKFFRFEVE